MTSRRWWIEEQVCRLPYRFKPSQVEENPELRTGTISAGCPISHYTIEAQHLLPCQHRTGVGERGILHRRTAV